MTQSAHGRPSGFDRFNDALRNLDDQVQELRDRFDDQRRKVEDEFQKRREKLEAQVRKSPLYKRADRVRKDIEEQVEQTRDQVLDVFGIATKHDLDKINRKLNLLSKKLNELSKEHDEA
jgi:hypothetical protein